MRRLGPPAPNSRPPRVARTRSSPAVLTSRHSEVRNPPIFARWRNTLHYCALRAGLDGPYQIDPARKVRFCARAISSPLSHHKRRDMTDNRTDLPDKRHGLCQRKERVIWHRGLDSPRACLPDRQEQDEQPSIIQPLCAHSNRRLARWTLSIMERPDQAK